MAQSKNTMLYGSPILMNDNTVPGVRYSAELEKVIPEVIQACLDFGLDPYPPVVELLTYDDISEVAAYGGFPVRFPHWSFGMEYEELSRGYEHGMHKIYEMVINSNPAYIYCLDSNPLLDHVTVIAHATGHSDFFKNNAWFEPTTENAMNELANHGSRMRRYMDRWGRERVIQFIDWVLSIDDLIDLSSSWQKRMVRDVQIKDKREYFYPRRLKLPSEPDGSEHDYMENWINTPEWREKEKRRVQRMETMRELHIFGEKRKDILGFLVEHAPLVPWQQDVISMLYREAQYFAPQALTKMLNEGWASYIDYNIMARRHWAGGDGIYDYARHKMGVLGGRYSMNPYALGFKLFLEIEERWNKGRFGREYEMCQDRLKRKNWDTKAGEGHEKVFEVRAVHNDLTAIHEFVDQDFVDKYEIYVWEKFPLPDGGWEYRIKTRDAKVIKKLLMARYSNGGRPDIRLVDPNYSNKGIFLMEHQWDGRLLAPRYAQASLVNLWNLWNNGGISGKRPVAIVTRDKDENEFLYVCTGPKDEQVGRMSRKVFEDNYGDVKQEKKAS
jgi:stage V sporulation protein R